MTALGLAIALGLGAPPSSPPLPSWWGGRVITTTGLHLGVRPALYVDDEARGGALEIGVGITVQLTTSLPLIVL